MEVIIVSSLSFGTSMLPLVYSSLQLARSRPVSAMRACICADAFMYPGLGCITPLLAASSGGLKDAQMTAVIGFHGLGQFGGTCMMVLGRYGLLQRIGKHFTGPVGVMRLGMACKWCGIFGPLLPAFIKFS
eukprot:TRINITY_DN76201_c0_g1_i1.p1 TRINITY_DN76201_c0_g1~~TRINITY_DN76201_c0_g1_i1.p1  ORF type:complete len:139 (+),score=10.51 TRINITY_DN76201_c0_g1_i1:27-419(+)